MENLQKTNKVKRVWNYFSTYEKIWFFSLFVASITLALIFPENDVNGASGVIITILYLLDVIVAIACELLIAKQSKWGQFLYVSVDIIELVILILLKARLMSMVMTVLFWLPIHIMTFANWQKHIDKEKQYVTEVRTLKWWQSLIMVGICVVGTFVFGYIVTIISPQTDFYNSKTIEKLVAYFDACVGIVSIFDGVLMLFRYKETWFVWYIAVVLESVINILSGQWILLVLKAGYLTNTTYGLIKWSKYIKNKQQIKENNDTCQIQVDTNN